MAALLALMSLLWLQASISLSDIGDPHVHGMLHTEYANARYLLLAVHSNDETIANWRDFFGTAKYRYNEKNEPAEAFHYAHHGLLKPTLTRLFVRWFGAKEPVVRVLCLLFSLGCTTLLYVFLRTHLPNLLTVWALTLLYVLLPLKLAYVDVWKYESAAELLMLAGLVSVTLAMRSPAWRWAYWSSMGLMFHTDYPAYLMAGAILVFLFVTRHRPRHWPLFAQGAVAATVGFISTVALQVCLGYGSEVIANAQYRIAGDLADVGLWAQLQHQWRFLLHNLGIAVVGVASVSIAYLVFRHQTLRNPLEPIRKCDYATSRYLNGGWFFGGASRRSMRPMDASLTIDSLDDERCS